MVSLFNILKTPAQSQEFPDKTIQLLFLPLQVGQMPLPKPAVCLPQFDACAPTIFFLHIQDGNPDSGTPEYMHLDGYRILSVKQYFSTRKLLLQGCAQDFKLLVSHILFLIHFSGAPTRLRRRSVNYRTPRPSDTCDRQKSGSGALHHREGR